MTSPSASSEESPAFTRDVRDRSIPGAFPSEDSTKMIPTDDEDHSYVHLPWVRLTIRASRSMLGDLTEYLGYPISVIKSAMDHELAITEEAMKNRSAFIHTAAEKLTRFNALSKRPAYPRFPADTDANRAALQNSAKQASIWLEKAQRCDPFLSNVYQTMESEFECTPGTGKAASKRLNQYWKDGGLEHKTFVSVFKDGE